MATGLFDRSGSDGGPTHVGGQDAAGAGVTTPRESGLDTSNGLEFVRQRVGLFAKVIVLMSLPFLIAGTLGGLLLRQSSGPGGTSCLDVTSPASIAHVIGLLLLAGVWLRCRRGPVSLVTLEWLDAASLVGACAAW